MTGLCVNGRCRGEEPPRTVLGGAYLCHVCGDRLQRNIAEFPSLYDDLGLRLTAAGSNAEPVTGSRDPGLKLNDAVADIRDRIRGALASWSRVVVEERGVNPPATGEVNATVGFLSTHADWLAYQPFADEVYAELSELRSRAFGLAYPSGRKWFAVGPCVTAGCAGTLTTTITATDDLLPSSLDCDTCALSLTADQWARLGKAMTTASDLARIFGVAVGTIYCWASEDDWRRSDLRIRPVRYNLEDARRSYQRRRVSVAS